MTHRIDRMTAEGLVTRERDENNRVRVIVELTDEGRSKWLDAMRAATVFEEDLLQDLSTAERGCSATCSPASWSAWRTCNRRADPRV